MSEPAREGWPSDHELDDLVRRFQACALDKHEWTHTAHLAVGAYYVASFGADDALARLRSGIRQLNLSLGGVNDDSNGYHETITAAYVRLIARAGGDGSAAAIRRLLAGRIAARDILLDFYSKDRLNSVAARRSWLEPDLAPFDGSTLTPAG